MPERTAPSPRRRKLRMVRHGHEPGDLVVVVRAAPATVADTVEDMVAAAEFSAETYVVERDGGLQELLCGVSVYARRPEAEADVLIRFSASPCYLEGSVGLLTATGFPVLPTGTDPDHYDVQLVPRHLEPDPERSRRPLGSEEYVFTAPEGGPLRRDLLHKRDFRPINEALTERLDEVFRAARREDRRPVTDVKFVRADDSGTVR